MFVEINDSKSGIKTINRGVPQGSTFWAFTFYLIINDLHKSLSEAYYILFADDTNISLKPKDHNKLVNMMNFELRLLSDWLNTNKLTINIEDSLHGIP